MPLKEEIKITLTAKKDGRVELDYDCDPRLALSIIKSAYDGLDKNLILRFVIKEVEKHLKKYPQPEEKKTIVTPPDFKLPKDLKGEK